MKKELKHKVSDLEQMKLKSLVAVQLENKEEFRIIQQHIEEPPKHLLDHQLPNELENIELMIQVCASKHELLKLLDKINRTLIENQKNDYHVNIKKIK